MNEKDAIKHAKRLVKKLQAQARRSKKLTSYYRGNPPMPEAAKMAPGQKAYQKMMSMAVGSWPELIVDSVEERLEVQAFRFKDESVTDHAWQIWQRNKLDAFAGTGHSAALVSGRAFAIVWRDSKDRAVITLEDAETVYLERSDDAAGERIMAIRAWWDSHEERHYVTLYTPDQVWKFQSAVQGVSDIVAAEIEHRPVSGEDYPIDHDFGLPVFDIFVNPSLSSDPNKRYQGEFESALEHIDRINYTAFSALATMTWSGFPLRALIGDPMVYADDGGELVKPHPGKNPPEGFKPVKPFDIAQDEVIQIENPDGKLIQLPAGDLRQYNDVLEMHVQHLAAITKTPAHYLLGQMINISADAIRAAEAGLISKVRRHMRSLGEGWEDIMRFALQLEGDAGFDDVAAEVVWKDPESRSLAERADAALKLKDILPKEAVLERILGSSPQEVSRFKEMLLEDQLRADLFSPAEEPEPAIA